MNGLFRTALSKNIGTVRYLQSISEKFKEFFKIEEKSAVVPIFKKALMFGHNTAIQDSNGKYSYHQIYVGSQKLALQLSNICGSAASKSVSIVCPNDVTSVISLWACWISGQVAVPLSNRYPCSVLRYIIDDSESNVLITTPEYENLMSSFIERMEIAVLVLDHTFLPEGTTPSRTFVELNNTFIIFATLCNDFYKESNAVIMYASESNTKPKGIIWTHKSMNEHIKHLTNECQFCSSDCFIHLMPQNSICGIIFLMCSLSNGGKVIMQDYFNNTDIWNALLNFNKSEGNGITILAAASDTYGMLIEELNEAKTQNNKLQPQIKDYCNENIRLMITSLLPLHSDIFYMWRFLTGHHLLVYNERRDLDTNFGSPFAQCHDEKSVLEIVGVAGPENEKR